MKFNPDNHITGKVYDLTQENMQAMLSHIDTLEKQLDEALMALNDALSLAIDSYEEKK
jgi:hypothetical protein